MNTKSLWLALALLGSAGVMAGCEQKTPLQKAGDDVKDAAKHTGDAMKDAAHDAKDAVKDATDGKPN